MGRSIETKIRRQEAREAKKEKRMKRAVEKFAEEREEIVKVDPLLPLNKKQKALLHALKNKTLIVVNGLAGTGKTYLASCYAADLLRENEIDKIIVSRPFVYMGNTSGFKPGGVIEKMGPFVRPMLENILSRLGKGAYSTLLGNGTNGRIEIAEFESIRGRSLGNSKEPVIVDVRIQIQRLRSITLSTYIIIEIKLGHTAVIPRLIEIRLGTDSKIKILNGKNEVLIIESTSARRNQAVNSILR